MKATTAIVFVLLTVAAQSQNLSVQGLFPNTCRSRTEKLAYAVDVALNVVASYCCLQLPDDTNKSVGFDLVCEGLHQWQSMSSDAEQRLWRA